MPKGTVVSKLGFFPPDSVTWKVNQEAVLLLGGGRALLMQIAHPLVAEGVARHSHFKEDPLGRLLRTLQTMLNILFGDRESAKKAALGIAQKHEPVHGALRERAGPYRRGTPYDAEDPKLLFYVYATLYDTSILVYEFFISPLSSEEKEEYYREGFRLASLLGIPRRVMPRSHRQFERVLKELLQGDTLTVSDTARELAQSVLVPPQLAFLRGLFAPNRLFTVGFLPEVLRERFGFPFTIKDQVAFQVASALVRRVLPLLPPWIRYQPAARKAARRWLHK